MDTERLKELYWTDDLKQIEAIQEQKYQDIKLMNDINIMNKSYE